LKVLRGRDGAADAKSLYNSLEVDLLPWCWERRDLRVPAIKTPPEVGYTNPCLRRKGCVNNIRPQFLSALKGWSLLEVIL
ncbi:hypothetical protein, partial [Candidatus Borrarchaeum sp.]|uniref:hypothetical protein n=1 Tax=Candidatus Borrarchaeum sp. TaxID=2846742 RepID=UPI00257FACF1